jgi:membrane carboxypeptidase/penicillin-binding protein PbpC
MELYFPWKTPEDLTKEEILDIITRIHSPNMTLSDSGEWEEYRRETWARLGWEAGISVSQSPHKRRSIEPYPMITERILQAKKRYCMWEKTELEKWSYKIPVDMCSGRSIELELSLSLELQNYTNEVIQKTLSRIEKENVTGSAVYIYNPSDKKVLAYVGNRWVSPIDGDIDMITRRRSVGSILKPFIYLLALREWAELESLILDDTRTYPTWTDGRVFVPQNYNPRTYGPVRLREALGNSLNSSTVRLSESIGIWRIYDFFRSVGLPLDHDAGYYWYGISLGTVELSLEHIVEAYSLLTDTEDPNIFLIEKALSDPQNRAKTFGISSILNSSIDLPVKTGTSTDFRDNWAVSYHKDAIIGIWVGNTDGSSMEDVSWVSGAWPIWHTVAEYMIGRWLMRDNETSIPTWVKDTLLCLDERCLRKERTYMKDPESIKSRTIDNIYYTEDFVWALTREEKEKWKIK